MQLVTVLVLHSLLCASAIRDNNGIWSTWKQLHGKLYNGELEEQTRKRQFNINLDKIVEHNLRHDHGLESYTIGLNQFSDLSGNEFRQRYLCNLTRKSQFIPENRMSNALKMAEVKDVPSSIDWRGSGRVATGRIQGLCGSSWAFAAVGAIEGVFSNHEFIDLSVQQLVDCSSDYGNEGCVCGTIENAYEYVKNYGIQYEQSYTYIARNSSCRYNAENVVTNITGYTTFPSGDEEALKVAVANYGPIAVAIDVQDDFIAYRGGIYSSNSCGTELLNHGALLVGYGSAYGEDYWIVQNSWGYIWGDDGSIRIARNKSNMCGIASAASIPIM